MKVPNRILVRLLVIALMWLWLGCVSAEAENRALLVGISAYDRATTGWTPLHGSNDVILLKPLLARQGFSDITVLTDREATKSNITAALKAMCNRCRAGDKIYFHFSGHGQPVRDDNGDEGPTRKYDQSVIPIDACRDSRKMQGSYRGENHLIDDELAPLLNALRVKSGKEGEVLVAVDACYSRGIEKDEITDIDADLVRFVRGTDIAFCPPERIALKRPAPFEQGAPLTVITACGETERNYEYKSPNGKMYGSLSYYIYILLKTDADFRRWRNCIANRKYEALGIFQSCQHPGVEYIP